MCPFSILAFLQPTTVDKEPDCLTILFLICIIQQTYFASNPSATVSAKFSSTMLAQWSQMTAW